MPTVGNWALETWLHEGLASAFDLVLSEPVPEEMIAIISATLDASST